MNMIYGKKLKFVLKSETFFLNQALNIQPFPLLHLAYPIQFLILVLYQHQHWANVSQLINNTLSRKLGITRVLPRMRTDFRDLIKCKQSPNFDKI